MRRDPLPELGSGGELRHARPTGFDFSAISDGTAVGFGMCGGTRSIQGRRVGYNRALTTIWPLDRMNKPV